MTTHTHRNMNSSAVRSLRYFSSVCAQSLMPLTQRFIKLLNGFVNLLPALRFLLSAVTKLADIYCSVV